MTWTEQISKREAAKDRLKTGELIGEMIAIGAISLVALFFVMNQVDDTGFFTSDFGALAMFLFYGSLLYGVVPPMLRIATGRRNMIRPFEIAGSIFFIIATVYLLSVFPFDFAYLTTLFPEDLRFVLDWMTDDIAKVLMTFGIVITAMVVVWTAFLYLVVKDWLMREASSVENK